jgi:transcriptional regulator with XRE-family HTH domain
MIFDQAALGRRIRAFRKACGLSQSDLGEKIGVSYQQIQKYENGTSGISVHQLFRMSAALKVPVDRLLSSASETGESPNIYDTPESGKILFMITEEELKLLERFRALTSRETRLHIFQQLKTLREMEESLSRTQQ